MGDYTLSADEPNLLFPQDNVANSYNMAPGVNLPPKQPVTAIMRADSPELKYLNVNLNGSRVAKFGTFAQQAPLELSYKYDGNDVTCKVKNISNWTIEDFAILIGVNSKIIGELVPGAEKEVKLPLDQTPLDQSFWGLVEQIYPSNYNGGIFPVNNKTDKEKSIKAAFLREQANNFSNTAGTVSTNALGQAFCFGWVSKPFEYAIKVNGQTQKPTSLELITALSPITQQEDGSAKLEIVKSYAQLNTSLTTSSGVTMRGDVISIEPGNTAVMDFNLSIASTLAITDMFLESGMQQGMTGTWSIYNWNTNAWDATDPKHRFTQDSLSKYIDSTGLVRLRVSVGSNDYAEGMPYIWVQGVRK
jgi:hypothetical protein